MKVDKITFQQTFPTGPYMNQKLGVEITLEANYTKDTLPIGISNAFAEAKKLVNDAFNAMNPHLTETIQGEETTNDKPPIDQTEQRIQVLIEDINACTSIDEKNGRNVQTGLISFLPLCAEDERIREAYELKLKQLS